jgi:ribose 5-phosphate isomerase A
VILGPLIAQEAGALDDSQQCAAKKAAALAAVALVDDGMTLGLGTGSTVAFFLEGLAARIQAEGLRVQGIPTSRGTEALAAKHGIPLIGIPSFADLANDLCVDGADRVDAAGHLIKGGGGALLREKMVAAASEKLCILVDATKLEPVLCNSFALPVECLIFGIVSTVRHLKAQGCTPRLREKDGSVWVSDNGNYVVDCTFSSIPDPAQTQASLLAIPGVVEVGLFVDMMSVLILGRPDGTTRVQGI